MDGFIHQMVDYNEQLQQMLMRSHNTKLGASESYVAVHAVDATNKLYDIQRNLADLEGNMGQ